MDQLNINSQSTMVSIPMSLAQSPIVEPAQIVTPAQEIRTDTGRADTTQEKNVDMQKLSEKLNTVAKNEHLDISFGYNDKIDKVFINIVDKNSGEVIRKLPSEEAIKFAEGMKDLLGKLFDRKG